MQGLVWWRGRDLKPNRPFSRNGGDARLFGPTRRGPTCCPSTRCPHPYSGVLRSPPQSWRNIGSGGTCVPQEVFRTVSRHLHRRSGSAKSSVCPSVIQLHRHTQLPLFSRVDRSRVLVRRCETIRVRAPYHRWRHCGADKRPMEKEPASSSRVPAAMDGPGRRVPCNTTPAPT